MRLMTSGASSGKATTRPSSRVTTPRATRPLAELRKQSAAMTSSTGLAVRTSSAGALVLADRMGPQRVEDREARGGEERQESHR